MQSLTESTEFTEALFNAPVHFSVLSVRNNLENHD